jgi:hypothetical protein
LFYSPGLSPEADNLRPYSEFDPAKRAGSISSIAFVSFLLTDPEVSGSSESHNGNIFSRRKNQSTLFFTLFSTAKNP